MRKTGHELFSNGPNTLDLSVRDFWVWSQSNLLENRNRGILAEFIVAHALKVLRCDSVRVEWDDWDLLTADGIKVEVKSAAYIQSWQQETHSRILFSVAPRRSLDGSLLRSADVYVFCLLHHRNRDTIDPLCMEQWTFYVISQAKLSGMITSQKTISLQKLISISPKTCDYLELQHIDLSALYGI